MRLALTLVLLASCNQPAHQNDVAASNDARTIRQAAVTAGPTFHSIGELTTPDDLEGELRGGRPAVPSEWPASFYTYAAGGSCTSTIVGDRVLLTAAHCVPNGGQISLTKAGQTYRGTCEHAPEYGKIGDYARTADYALCAIDRPIPGVAAERINVRPQDLTIGRQVLLTGFGCTTNAGTGGNDGVYRIGEANIQSLPSGDNNDIVVQGPAGVCFGDSGGPAFLIRAGQPRVQISVNSRVEVRQDEPNLDLGPHSFLSSLTSKAGADFLAKWSARTGLRLCGLHADAKTCRPA
jgi:hypothetical protein